jgi:hypothetical protein
MVILPDVFYISEYLKESLEEYVNGGGKLFLSGETGLFEKDGKKRKDFALKGLIGASYISKIDKYQKAAWGGYLSPSKHSLLKSISDTYAPVSSVYYGIAPASAEALNYFVYPATELTENTWVNWWNPPPITHNPSQNPGIIFNNFGKGKVIYAAFDFLRMAGKDFHYTNGLFEDIAYYFLEKPSLYLNTQNKNALSIVSYDRPENSEIIVHEISHIAAECSGDAPEIKAGKLIISKDYRQLTKAEIVYPEHYCLDIKERDGNQVIVLPDISIHQIILLQYSK